MAENAVSVTFEATAETTQAETQMAKLGASTDATMQGVAKNLNATAVNMSKTVAQSAKEQNATLDQTRQIYEKLGLSGTQANQEIARAFGVSSLAAEQATQSVARTGNQLRQAQASAMILERQMGIHMPRAINAMLARSELIGPLLQGAFAAGILILFAENIRKIINQIAAASLAIGGFGKEAQKAFAENIKANDDLLIHFQGVTTQAKIATGTFLISQTNLQLVALEGEKATLNWAKAAAAVHAKWYEAIWGPLGLVSGLVRAGKALVDKTELTNREAELQKRLIAQVAELGKLEEQNSKQRDNAARKAEAEAKRQEAAEKRRQQAEERFNQLLITQGLHFEKLAEKTEKWQVAQLAKNLKETDKAMRSMFDSTVALTFATDALAAATPKLSGQERLALPTLREKQLLIQNLTKLYPNLTKAEIEHWAQMKAGDAAYRQMTADMVKHGNVLKQQRLDWQMLSAQVRTAISQITGSLMGWGGVATRIFDQMANQIIRQIELDQAQAIEHHAAQVSMMTSTVMALKQIAIVKAAFEVAEAIKDAALGEWRAAATHALAAVKYGVVGGLGIAAMVGAMGGGGAAGRGVSAAEAAGTTTTAKPAAAQPQPTTIVRLEGIKPGDLFTGDQLRELASTLSQASESGRIRLVATTIIAPPQRRT